MGPNNRGRLARLPRICLIFLFVVVVKNLIGTQKIAFEGVMERAIATFTEETRVLRTELVSVGQACGRIDITDNTLLATDLALKDAKRVCVNVALIIPR